MFCRLLLVLCESMAGTGHKINRLKVKGTDKLEFLYEDPYGKILFITTYVLM